MKSGRKAQSETAGNSRRLIRRNARTIFHSGTPVRIPDSLSPADLAPEECALIRGSAVDLSDASKFFKGHVIAIQMSDHITPAGQSDARLSTIVNFLTSPLIVLLIGWLVGFLSEDRPIATMIIGLVPWTIMLLSGPNKPASISGWLGWLLPVLVYMPLGAATAEFAWRIRHKTTAKPRSLA
jgi:hypothetical protein